MNIILQVGLQLFLLLSKCSNAIQITLVEQLIPWLLPGLKELRHVVKFVTNITMQWILFQLFWISADWKCQRSTKELSNIHYQEFR